MQTYIITAPSNIAFLKYWGKQSRALQWPSGNSLSMTLSKSMTTTEVKFSSDGFDKIYFDDEKSPTQDEKILSQIKRIRQHLESDKFLTIKTRNTFPSSCGIASSASGLCAVTIGAFCCFLGCGSFDELESKGVTKDVLSNFSRLGSGSACRSMFGGYVSWYKGDSAKDQKVVRECDGSEFKLADLIFVLSSEKKLVGSTEAHDRAWSSPLFGPRLAIIEERHKQMLKAIHDKNFSQLGHLLELDALEMHAVIMTSKPPINYWDKNTANFVRWIREKRGEGTFEAYATIDAGPNVHVICKPEDGAKIIEEAKQRFSFETVISDELGDGPSITTKN